MGWFERVAISAVIRKVVYVLVGIALAYIGLTGHHR